MDQVLLINPLNRKKSTRRYKKMSRRKTSRRRRSYPRRRKRSYSAARRNPVRIHTASILKDVVPAVAGGVATGLLPKLFRLKNEVKPIFGIGLTMLGYTLLRPLLGSKTAMSFSVGAGTITGVMALDNILKKQGQPGILGQDEDEVEDLDLIPPLEGYESLPDNSMSGYEEVDDLGEEEEDEVMPEPYFPTMG